MRLANTRTELIALENLRHETGLLGEALRTAFAEKMGWIGVYQGKPLYTPILTMDTMATLRDRPDDIVLGGRNEYFLNSHVKSCEIAITPDQIWAMEKLVRKDLGIRGDPPRSLSEGYCSILRGRIDAYAAEVKATEEASQSD